VKTTKTIDYKKETIKRLKTAQHYIVIVEQEGGEWSYHNSPNSVIQFLGYLDYMRQMLLDQLHVRTTDIIEGKRTVING